MSSRVTYCPMRSARARQNRPSATRAPAAEFEGALAVSSTPEEEEDYATELRLERIRAARIKGYEGDSCEECGNFTLIRNGTCLKCDTCGATSGCS
jgi:ribonucleoside-diphosphate reductase alpha chain